MCRTRSGPMCSGRMCRGCSRSPCCIPYSVLPAWHHPIIPHMLWGWDVPASRTRTPTCPACCCPYSVLCMHTCRLRMHSCTGCVRILGTHRLCMHPYSVLSAWHIPSSHTCCGDGMCPHPVLVLPHAQHAVAHTPYSACTHADSVCTAARAVSVSWVRTVSGMCARTLSMASSHHPTHAVGMGCARTRTATSYIPACCCPASCGCIMSSTLRTLLRQP